MKYLIKFGYDGTKFSGYQRGNGSRSVEDAIISVLKKYGISEEIQSAGRTDKYVSAAGNVMSLQSREKPEKIIGILNSEIENMFFHSYAEVEDSFNVRHNKLKHYRYTITGDDIFLKNTAEIIKKFEGRHDFSFFSRKDSRNPVRTIDRIICTLSDKILQVDVYGKSFVWNQIRCIVGFSKFNAERGNEIGNPFDIESKFPFLAEPEPLILMDVEYENVIFKRKFKAGKIRSLENKLQSIENEKRNLEALLSMK